LLDLELCSIRKDHIVTASAVASLTSLFTRGRVVGVRGLNLSNGIGTTRASQDEAFLGTSSESEFSTISQEGRGEGEGEDGFNSFLQPKLTIAPAI